MDRIFTAPTSARSRESVAWVTVMPIVARFSARSIWECTDVRVMRSMIFCCRAVFVSGAEFVGDVAFSLIASPAGMS